MHVVARGRPLAGENVSGDEHVYLEIAGRSIIALADGLGHGPLAAEAARAFCTHVSSHPRAELEELMRGADRALSGTRGAAGAVMTFEEATGELMFVGVGNIGVTTARPLPTRFFSTPGILGRGFPRVHTLRCSWTEPNVIALYSDGISSRLDLSSREPTLERTVDALLERFGKLTDDALLVLAEHAPPGTEP
jgi:phosphoserine phosphatase RsbX